MKQAFLDVVGFWKTHILDCSLIANPLYQVTQKNDLTWSPEQQALKQTQQTAHAAAFGPAWAGQDTMREQSHLKPLAESPREDSRSALRFWIQE